jgi:butyryl-CoA dehydrogenase
MSEQTELLDALKKYCHEHIEPFMEEDDEAGRFRFEIFKGLGEFGVTGATAPTEYEGHGLSYREYVQILETIAGFSVPYAVTVSVSHMVQAILLSNGSKEQKDLYLPPLARGEEIGAFALSESHSGSDASGLKTTAKKVDGGYILNGTKMWITSAGVAKTYIVMARTGTAGSKGISAFIVRDGTPGFSYGKAEKKMGWRTSPTREIIFENCFIPEKNLVGIEGEGLKVALTALDRGRMTIGAIGVGLAQRALDEALHYSLERQQFNQPIFDFQGLQFMLADMCTETTASRLVVYEAARLYDENKSDGKMASIAKLKATDNAMKVTTDAVQILGGVGYTSEYPLERYMRDAKVLQIVEGTNQIQRVVIARQLRKDHES